MLVIIREYPNIDIKNFMQNKVVYCLNNNNLAKTLILIYNNTNILKKLI